jgi:hypothetical protein
LKNTFPHIQADFGGNPVNGKSYLIGTDPDSTVKLDIYYSSEPFFQELIEQDAVRMATIEEIIAMKVDVVQRTGRKKDFWDLHELLETYSIVEMINLHEKRFKWTHDRSLIETNFTDFSGADLDFDPVCLRGKEWVFIKEDIIEAASGFNSDS